MINLHNGNCLEILNQYETGYADMCFTSPPYNMRTRIRNGKYTTREKSEHFSKKYQSFDDALSIDDYYEFHKHIIYEMMRLSNIIVYNVQIVTGSKEAIFKLIGHFNRYIKDIIVWDKGHGQPAMHEGVLNKATELILIFESDAKAGRAFTNYNFGRGELSDIWRIGRERSVTKSHGATMPLKLAEMAILNFSKEGQIIIEPFMGTGTTVVICKQNNRNFVGIEISKDYYDIAKNRIESVLL
ncbi:MAG: DNA-methyltransferase [Fluviibacter sp.]